MENASEIELLKRVISWANNSLFGSHGFFLSKNGGPPDEHHLDSAIEEMKAYSRAQWRRAEAAEAKALAIRKALAQIAGQALTSEATDEDLGELGLAELHAGYDYLIKIARAALDTSEIERAA